MNEVINIYVGYDHFNERETFHNGAPNDKCPWLQYLGTYSHFNWEVSAEVDIDIRCNIVEVDALTHQDKYVYPINAYCSEVDLFGSKPNTFFGNHIHEKVINDLSIGRTLLHINFIHETYRFDAGDMKRLYKFLREYNIPPIFVLLTADNHRLQGDFNIWADENNINNREKIQIVEIPFGEVSVESYGTALGTKKVSLDLIKNDDGLRTFHFMNLMGSGRHHRNVMVDWIELSKLDDKILYSALWRGKRIPEQFHWPYDPEKFGIRLGDPNEMPSHLFDPNYNFDMDLTPYDEKLNPYYHSYCEIVTETMFYDEFAIQLSDKTFKPIFNLQPFIVVGSPGHLNKVRELGYKTFPSIFNESYDNIENDGHRMQMINSEIKKVCNWPINTLHEKYYDIIDDLIYNRDNFYKNNEGKRFILQMVEIYENIRN